MAGVWKPKFKHLCRECGWRGTRTRWTRRCPKCRHWAPHEVVPAHEPWPKITTEKPFEVISPILSESPDGPL